MARHFGGGTPPGTRWLRGGGGNRAMLTMTTPQKGSHQWGMLPNPDGGWSMMHSPPESDQWENNAGNGSLQQLMQWLQQMMARQGQGQGQAGSGTGNLGQGAGTQAGGQGASTAPIPRQGGYPTNTEAPPPGSAPTTTASAPITPNAGPPQPSTAASNYPTFAWGLDQ